MTYLLALSSIGLGAVGQFLLKVGALQLRQGSPAGPAGFLAAVAKTPLIYAGLFCFGTSFLLWIWVLTKMDLSRAYPLVGLSYVIILVLSHFILREPVTLARAGGVALVVAGVLLISRA